MKFVALPRITVMELTECLRSLMDDDDTVEVIFNRAELNPLTRAVYDGDENKVEELLEQEPDTQEPNCIHYFGSNNSPLIMALTCQRFKILVLLLQAYHRTTRKIGHTMSKTRRELTSFVNSGCNMDYLRLLFCYFTDKYQRNWLKNYLMFHAIKRQNIDTVRDLLVLGVDVHANFRRECFLHVAVRSGDPKIIQLLIENNADINGHDHLLETPLFVAVRTNNLDVATLLVQLGANVNFQNSDKQTPLHIAATSVYDSIDMVRVLLKNGALFNIQDHAGNTPLALSLRNFMLHPKFPITKCLIQHGSLPVQSCEMEALKWAANNTRDDRLLKYMDRAGIQNTLNTNSPVAKRLLLTFRTLLMFLSMKHETNNPTYNRYYQLQMAPSLYLASLATIRTHLTNIATGESIYNRVQALPLPESIRRDLLLEE